MKLMPEYAHNIIVGVVFRNQWSWYITEREYWFLNVEMEDRFGIEVLDETTAAEFFRLIADFRVPSTELSQMLVDLRDSFQHQDEVLEFVPALYVHFDDRLLYSLFPEPMSFERYVPEGWAGEYRDFLELVPEAERYWMIQGKNFFSTMSQR